MITIDHNWDILSTVPLASDPRISQYVQLSYESLGSGPAVWGIGPTLWLRLMSKRYERWSSPTPASPSPSSMMNKRRRYWQKRSSSSSSYSSSSSLSLSGVCEQGVEVEEGLVQEVKEGTPPPAFPPLPPPAALPPFYHYRHAPYVENAGTYKVGDLVDYHSKTHKVWLPATVIDTDLNSAIVIDLKQFTWIPMEQQAWKIRPRGHVKTPDVLTELELNSLSEQINHVVLFISPIIKDVKAALFSHKPQDLEFDSILAGILMRHGAWVPKRRADKIDSLIACLRAVPN